MTVSVDKRTVAIACTAIAAMLLFGIVRFALHVRDIDRAADAFVLDSGPQASLLYDRQGQVIFTLATEERMDRRLDELSPSLIPAVLAAEDRYFRRHVGVDFVRIIGAAWRNLKSGRVEQGASTITQQLVRAQALGRERTWSRKWREVLLALRVDRRFTKDQILETYLNRIYLGDGYFGVQAAARGYFGKDASQLTVAESALLAGIIRCPSSCSPREHADRALNRRNIVLSLMRKATDLPADELQTAKAQPLQVAPVRPEGLMASQVGGEIDGRFFVDAVRRELVARFGEAAVMRGGLRVYTTLDLGMQKAAEAAMTERLTALNTKETRARKGIENPNHLEGSLVAIEPRSGAVYALVGGRSFHESPFDRATQARRQPGSAFKPIFFAAALEQGYSPADIVDDLDSPIAAAEGDWLPGGDHEESVYTLRQALTVSSNRAAAQLLQRVGIANAQRYARQLGISSPMPAVPSLALGTAEVSLIDLTSAYGVFANGGLLQPHHLIARVEDPAGEVLWRYDTAPTRAVKEETAFLMSTMLADVINRGTATGVRAAGFRLPAGGKTGTTDRYADAWFVGFTPHLVTGVWFGRDMPGEIMRGGYAATVAVPAWASFMKAATRGDKPDWLKMPSSLERVPICQVTGMVATEECRHAAELGEGKVADDYFQRGMPRPPLCPGHIGALTDGSN